MTTEGRVQLTKIPRALTFDDIDKYFRSSTRQFFKTDCVILVQHPLGQDHSQAIVDFSIPEAATHFSRKCSINLQLVIGRKITVPAMEPKATDTAKGVDKWKDPGNLGHTGYEQHSILNPHAISYANSRSYEYCENSNKEKCTPALQSEQIKPNEATLLCKTSANVDSNHSEASAESNTYQQTSPRDQSASPSRRSDEGASKYVSLDDSNSNQDGGRDTDSSLCNESQNESQSTDYTEHSKWEPLSYEPTPTPAEKASSSPGRNTSVTNVNDYHEDQQATGISPSSEDGKESSHDPTAIVTDLWKLLTLTKAKALKKIERKHNISRRSVGNDWPDLTDLTAEYGVSSTHPAFYEMMSLYLGLFDNLEVEGSSIEEYRNQQTVAMALNQTRAMYANVLIKEKYDERGEMRVIFQAPPGTHLAKGARNTFEEFVGMRKPRHSPSRTDKPREADRYANQKEHDSPKQTARRLASLSCDTESNGRDGAIDTSDLPINEKSSDDVDPSQANESNVDNGTSMSNLNNDASIKTNQSEQSEEVFEMKTDEGGDWVTITGPREDQTKENPERLFPSDAHRNLKNYDHGKKQIVEHASPDSETVSRNFGTEACGLTGTDTTSDPADLLSKDQERSVTEPSEIFSQPASGKFSISMNKKKHLPGHEKEGLQKLMFKFPSGTLEAGLGFPGKTFAAASFTAYLPNSKQGKQLMRLLKEAFVARRLFTVIRSFDESRLEPNGVNLKSEIDGENGYPDHTYLDRLGKKLQSLGFED